LYALKNPPLPFSLGLPVFYDNLIVTAAAAIAVVVSLSTSHYNYNFKVLLINFQAHNSK
jgi:hypothetical protein